MEETMEEVDVADEYSKDRHVYRDITVNTENGLHLRPAAQVVELAESYDGRAEVQMYDPKDNKYQDIDLLALMELAATKGSKIKFRARGTDAEEALDRIAETLDGRL
jgi:phosphotransferase system HPr (HPr) family protein